LKLETGTGRDGFVERVLGKIVEIKKTLGKTKGPVKGKVGNPCPFALRQRRSRIRSSEAVHMQGVGTL
jgi:hypothetical protein